MLLASLLDSRLMYYEPQIKTREEIYRDMVSRICRNYPLPICGSELVKLVLERDEETSTAYPTGLAIPHIRMEGFNDTLISVCIPAHHVDYEGTHVSVIVLIITNKSATKLYLNIVAALLKLSKDREAMRTLGKVKDGHYILTTIKQMGITIKEKLTVSDIMISAPVTITPEAKLNELGDLMNKHDIAVLPVVDENKKFLGEVNVLNLLKVGVPDYLMMMTNLNFLESFEPLEKLFESEDIVTVGEIMNKECEVLSPDASIIEAVFLMIKHEKRFYSVVDHGTLVGILTSMDVFGKVFKV